MVLLRCLSTSPTKWSPKHVTEAHFKLFYAESIKLCNSSILRINSNKLEIHFSNKNYEWVSLGLLLQIRSSRIKRVMPSLLLLLYLKLFPFTLNLYFSFSIVISCYLSGGQELSRSLGSNSHSKALPYHILAGWCQPAQTPAKMKPSLPHKAAHSTWPAMWSCTPSDIYLLRDPLLTALIFGRTQRRAIWVHRTTLQSWRVTSPLLRTITSWVPQQFLIC